LASGRNLYVKNYEDFSGLSTNERLLYCKLKAGWGLLCDVLRKEFPGGNPTPDVNVKMEYEKKRI
jgi:hypothetical protein